MLKWVLFFLGGVAFLVIAFLLFFMFMVWSHERGFPKSILVDELKGSCVVSRTPFVLTKSSGGFMPEPVWNFLPIPEGREHIYRAYVPGSVTDSQGADIIDIADTIKVPAGTRFILKDGFQNRDMNSSDYYFWLEPEGIDLDSSFFYNPTGLEFEGPENTPEVVYDRSEEMTRFPDNALFAKHCEDEAG